MYLRRLRRRVDENLAHRIDKDFKQAIPSAPMSFIQAFSVGDPAFGAAK